MGLGQWPGHVADACYPAARVGLNVCSFHCTAPAPLLGQGLALLGVACLGGRWTPNARSVVAGDGGLCGEPLLGCHADTLKEGVLAFRVGGPVEFVLGVKGVNLILACTVGSHASGFNNNLCDSSCLWALKSAHLVKKCGQGDAGGRGLKLACTNLGHADAGEGGSVLVVDDGDIPIADAVLAVKITDGVAVGFWAKGSNFGSLVSVDGVLDDRLKRDACKSSGGDNLSSGFVKDEGGRCSGFSFGGLVSGHDTTSRLPLINASPSQCLDVSKAG